MLSQIVDIVNNILTQCREEPFAMILLFAVICGVCWIAVMSLKASV